ncbi:unnamed protein product, partial [Phaeothamnion confervicola]
QGDPLGPVFFTIGILAAMHAFQATFAASGASPIGYLDELAVLGMPGDTELSPSLIAAVQQLKVDLAAVGLELNMQKSTILSPSGFGAADLSATTLAGLAMLDIPVVHDGVKVVGVPIGSDEFVRAALQAKLEEGPIDRFVQKGIELEEAQPAVAMGRKSFCPWPIYEAWTSAPVLAARVLCHCDATAA